MNAIPHGQTLAFLFLGFGGKGRAKRATIPFLAEARRTLARAQLPSMPTRYAIIWRVLPVHLQLLPLVDLAQDIITLSNKAPSQEGVYSLKTENMF